MEATGPRAVGKAGHTSSNKAGDARPASVGLAHLESVLQRLNRQEERSQMQSVERMSTDTQVKLLRDQLLRVQEELALAQASKGKLCEQIGALQQTKSDQQAQIGQLLSELCAARESQAAVAAKAADVENASLNMKRSYVRSLTCRVKVATDLLAKLHVANCFDQEGFTSGIVGYRTTTTDLSCHTVSELLRKCDTWSDVDSNKRKRNRFCEEHPVVDKTDGPCVMTKEPKRISSPLSLADDLEDDPIPANDCSSRTLCDAPVEVISDTSIISEDSEVSRSCHKQGDSEVTECQSCIELARQNAQMKAIAEKDLEENKLSLAALEARLVGLEVARDEALHRSNEYQLAVSERDAQIRQLQQELASERQKVQMPIGVEKPDANEDPNGRVKVLEDNLAQLNTYADHLELIISQCASCSVKLQSENTQT